MKNKNDFEYKYVAPTINERREIESIRNSYLKVSTPMTKLGRLRKLDNKVINMPRIISIIIGVMGTLTFGLGLTMILEWNVIVAGIIVSLVGLIPISCAYLLFKVVKKHLTNKYSGEIIKLSDELLNND